VASAHRIAANGIEVFACFEQAALLQCVDGSFGAAQLFRKWLYGKPSERGCFHVSPLGGVCGAVVTASVDWLLSAGS